MTREEFDRLVEQLEVRYRDKGEALTRTAVLWAIMGYAVLVLGLLVSLGLAVLCAGMILMAPNAITIKLGLVFGISGLWIGWSILRGAWIRLSPPVGRQLLPQQAPRLFEMIDETSLMAGGIRFHQVLLTEDLNACVVQIPRLGVLGWYRNYLCLGLQLMDALSPQEFHAVLAHEFAHLSKAHGRTGNWLYRIRRTWENVANALSNQSSMLVRPLARFFSWYWPRFNARAFVLSRSNEYQADAFSARTTSPATVGRALSRIAVESQRIEQDFWESLNERSSRESEPPAAIFDELALLLKKRMEPANASRWLAHQLALSTDTSDTHPALKDRIAAVCPGEVPAVIEPVEKSAADDLLGKPLAADVRADFSRKWLEAHEGHWRESHANSEKLREQLAELESSADTPRTKWEKLRIRCNLQGVPAVADELASFLHENPSHHVARFILGCHLLSEDDPKGLPMLESVVAAAPQSALECYGQLAAYHDRHGNRDAILELKRLADAHDAKMQQAVIERSHASPNDSFESHGLTDEEKITIRKALGGVKELQKAYLVRKSVRIMPEWKSYIMVVNLKFPTLKFITDTAKQEVLQQIVNAVDLDGYIVVFNDEGDNKALAKRIRTIPGTEVF